MMSMNLIPKGIPGKLNLMLLLDDTNLKQECMCVFTRAEIAARTSRLICTSKVLPKFSAFKGQIVLNFVVFFVLVHKPASQMKGANSWFSRRLSEWRMKLLCLGLFCCACKT